MGEKKKETREVLLDGVNRHVVVYSVCRTDDVLMHRKVHACYCTFLTSSQTYFFLSFGINGHALLLNERPVLTRSNHTACCVYLKIDKSNSYSYHRHQNPISVSSFFISQIFNDI